MFFQKQFLSLLLLPAMIQIVRGGTAASETTLDAGTMPWYVTTFWPSTTVPEVIELSSTTTSTGDVSTFPSTAAPPTTSTAATTASYMTTTVTTTIQPTSTTTQEESTTTQEQTSDGRNYTTIDFCASNPCEQVCEPIFNGFNCSCNDGYRVNSANTSLCDDINECYETTSCASTVNSICSNTIGNFSCDCRTGYEKSGSICIDIDECSWGSDNCSSETSTCGNSAGSFFCDCKTGYQRPAGMTQTFICEDINECITGTFPCVNRTQLCQNTIGSYQCICRPGYQNVSGSCIDINECTETATNVCEEPNNRSVFTNNEGSFSCACKPGFTGNGTFCHDINECSNDETCSNNSHCNNTIGGYFCTCHSGYQEMNGSCVNIDVNECTRNIDVCDFDATCTNTAGSFDCNCNPGFTGNGTSCRDIDECTNNIHNCGINATCTNKVGSFHCNCNPGYTGNGTSCSDIDECTGNIDDCDVNANCANTDGSFHCNCNLGYTGNGTSCADFDECTGNIDDCDVNANCTNTPGSFHCNCNRGYTGNGTSCSDIDECTGNIDDCDVNANCTNTPGSFHCNCNRGYTGNGTSCSDIDECTGNIDDCDVNANCTNTPGSFHCNCNRGYTGNGTSCSDIDECTGNIDDCDVNANCTNTDGSFYCNCNRGYTGNGTSCSDIDECTGNIDDCDVNANCTNTPGSFHCNCNRGYTGNGTSCSDIDECTGNIDDCDVNANCTNTPGSFHCNCNRGYTGNGTSCSDIDECTGNIDDCDVNANCTNTPGSFHCNCNRGYTGNGTSCSDIDECTGNIDDCDVNANCTNTDGSFHCNCNRGYTGNGTSCSDIDECTGNIDDCDVNANCTNTHGSCMNMNECRKTATNVCEEPNNRCVCINNEGSFYCACNDGFIGNGMLCNDINECSNAGTCSNNSRCNNTLGGYFCICNFGYQEINESCVNIDECANSLLNNCAGNNTSNCMDTAGSFTCECASGFSGDGVTCSDINECVLNPCDVNAMCDNSFGSYSCSCNKGFYFEGSTCADIPSLPAPIITGRSERCILLLLDPTTTFGSYQIKVESALQTLLKKSTGRRVRFCDLNPNTNYSVSVKVLKQQGSDQVIRGAQFSAIGYEKTAAVEIPFTTTLLTVLFNDSLLDPTSLYFKQTAQISAELFLSEASQDSALPFSFTAVNFIAFRNGSTVGSGIATTNSTDANATSTDLSSLNRKSTNFGNTTTVTNLPTAPVNLNIAVTESSATITYSAVDNATSYLLEMQCAGQSVITESASSMSYVYSTTTLSNKICSVRVRALVDVSSTANAPTTYSDPQEFTTAAFFSNVETGTPTGTGVIVTFDAIDRAVNYTVTTSPSILEMVLTSANEMNGKVIVDVTGLSAMTTYTFTLNAVVQDHTGAYVSVPSITTSLVTTNALTTTPAPSHGSSTNYIASTTDKVYRSTNICEKDTIYSLAEKSYTFNKTLVNLKAYSIERCSKSGLPKASIICKRLGGSPDNKASFDEKTLLVVPCTNSTLSELIDQATSSYRTTASPEESLRTLDFASFNASALKETDVTSIVKFTSGVAENTTKITSFSYEHVVAIVDHVSNFLELSSTNISSIQLNTSVVQSLTTLAYKTVLPAVENFLNVSTFNIVAQIFDQVEPTSPVHFEPEVDANDEIIRPVSITIPLEVLQFTDNNLARKKRAQSDNSTIRTVFMLHRTSILFPSNEKINWVVSGDVGTQTATGTFTQLKEQVNITHLTVNTEAGRRQNDSTLEAEYVNQTCVFWNFNTSSWSAEGCSLVAGSNPPQCLCNHLTNFAILFSIHDVPPLISLQIVSYVGSSISIFCLLLTILLLLIPREFRKRRPTKALLNILANILLVYLIFMLGIDKRKHVIGCVVATTLLHYFLLCTWCWMATYAHLLFKSVVVVMNITWENYLLKASLFSYGISFLIVSINLIFVRIFAVSTNQSTILDADLESPFADTLLADNLCWMKGNSLYFAFLLPFGLLLLFNILVFFSVVTKLTCKKEKISSSLKKKTVNQQLIIAITIATTLGLIWIIGYFMMLSTNPKYLLIISWIFTILASLQGLFIFLLICVRQKDVRRIWWPRLRRLTATYRSYNVTSRSNVASNSRQNQMRSAADQTSTTRMKLSTESAIHLQKI